MSLAGGKIDPYQIDHAATAVTMPAKPKKADLDWSARSSGVGMIRSIPRMAEMKSRTT